MLFYNNILPRSREYKIIIERKSFYVYNIYGDFMNKKLKAVILDGYTENPGDLSWDPIGNLTDLTVYDRTPEELVIERAKDAEILIVNKVKLTEEIITRATTNETTIILIYAIKTAFILIVIPSSAAIV